MAPAPPCASTEGATDGSAPTERRRWFAAAAVGAAATVGMVLTYRYARHTTSGARFTAFWLSMLAGLGVAAFAGIRLAATDRARRALLLAVGLFTYLPKFMMSVSGPVFFDEFGQLRHANDLLAGQPTPPSTYLPILQFYPGLGLATGVVHTVTRLSTWHSGQVVVLVAHCATLVLAQQLARAAGLGRTPSYVAALVFALNPSFTYFDTQYAYESLGIALAMAAALAATRARQARTRDMSLAWAITAFMAAAACVVTHHVSTAVMVGLLVVVALLVPTGEPDLDAPVRVAAARGPWVVAGLAVTMAGLWWGIEATPTFDYIAPHIDQSLAELQSIAGIGSHTAAAGAHVPFSGGSVQAEARLPAYEKVAAYLSPVIALALCALGARRIWRQGRRSLLRAAPALALAAAYFASLPVALTSSGGEVAHRSWSFTYIGIGIVGAAGLQALTELRLPSQRRTAALAAAACAMAVVCVGNVSSGESPLYRFPGPYAFGVDSRANTAEARAMAAWVRQHLPAHSKVLADKDTDEIITAYTTDTITSPKQTGAYSLYRVGPDVSANLRALLHHDGYSYFVLDTRVLTQLPLESFFAGYHAPRDINRPALARMPEGTFAVLVHTVGPFQIYRFDYAAPPPGR